MEAALTESMAEILALMAEMPPDLRVMLLRLACRQLSNLAEIGSELAMREEAR
jgi:xanthine dehydrogenase iron-sulfur cluster and FAD-binding subunit A